MENKKKWFASLAALLLFVSTSLILLVNRVRRPVRGGKEDREQ